MTNPYRAVRQFERMLFRGVPEQPESMWQGHGQVNDRPTGRSLSADGLPAGIDDGATYWATLVYEVENEGTAAQGDRARLEPRPVESVTEISIPPVNEKASCDD